MYPLDALLAELSEFSTILVFLNSQWGPSPTEPVRMLNAHLAELLHNLQQVLSATMSQLHSLTSWGVQQPHRYSSSWVVDFIPVPQHIFVWLLRVQKCILSAPVFRDHNPLSYPPGMKPQRPSVWNQTHSYRMHNYSIQSQHIYGTHTDMHIRQTNAGKTVMLY